MEGVLVYNKIVMMGNSWERENLPFGKNVMQLGRLRILIKEGRALRITQGEKQIKYNE